MEDVNNKNNNVNDKQNNSGKGSEKKVDKDTLINKKDVDEYDLSDEYFSNNKHKSDGEDF